MACRVTEIDHWPQGDSASWVWMRGPAHRTPQVRFNGIDAHACSVVVSKEREGYSAVMLSLPGVASQGETIEQAMANLHEAAVGAISEYLAAGEEIPWVEEPEMTWMMIGKDEAGGMT